MIFAISGHITSNTIWSADQTVTGDLWVDANVVLTIQAGVHVRFPFVDQNTDTIGDTDFIINGRLIVQGTTGNKVYFESMETVPGRKDWGGIDILTLDTGTMSSLTSLYIKNAYQGIHVNGKGASVVDCTITNTFDYGVRVQTTSSPTSFTDCQIDNGTGYGFQAENGNVQITNMLIYRMGSYGLKASTPSQLTVNGLNSTSNGGTGIWMVGMANATFGTSRAVSNAFYGLLVENGSPSFNNCQFLNNYYSGVKIVGSSGTPVFSYCSINKNEENGFMVMGQNATISYSTIWQNKGTGVTVVHCAPAFTYSNIYGNLGVACTGPDFIKNTTSWLLTNYGTSTLPTNVLQAPFYLNEMTYKKDGDSYYNSSSARTITHYSKITANSIDYLVNNYSYYIGSYSTYDMPEQTVNGVINQLIPSNSSLIMNIYQADYIPNARMWSVQFKTNQVTTKQVAIFNNSGTIANFQYCWWGQISGVNDLVQQLTAGTINYDNLSLVLLTDSASTLPNTAPSLTVLTPSTLTINPTNVAINFTSMDIDNNAQVSLYYDDGLDYTGTLITSNLWEDSSTTYTWNVSAVTHGIYRIYGVINDGTNTPVYSYAPERVVVGEFKVWIPNDLYASSADTLIVPVKIKNVLTEYDIIAYQMTVSYNQNIVNYVSMEQTGTLSENWTVNYNNSTPGQISFNAFSTSPLTAAGDLLQLRFRINSAQADNQFSDLNLSDCILNAGTPTVLTANGKITVYNKYNITGSVSYYSNSTAISAVDMSLTGRNTLTQATNVSGAFNFAQQYYGAYTLTPTYNHPIPDLVITPYDASLVARYALGLVTFNGNQVYAADVNGDSNVTVFDAARIAQYSVGIITSFTPGVMKFVPVSSSFTLNNVYTPRTFVGLAYGDPSGNWNNAPAPEPVAAPQIVRSADGIYQLSISAAYPFYSYLADVVYDTLAVELISVQYNDAVSAMQQTVNQTNGRCAVAAFGTEVCSSTDAVITFRFRALTDFAELPVTLMRSLFDENSGHPEWTDNSDNTIPSVFSLEQNYPNPFNPTTRIRYSLPKSAEVRLDIYNTRGQHVATLVNGKKTAGTHTFTWNAEGCASGMYLYRLQAGNKVLNRKMLLLK